MNIRTLFIDIGEVIVGLNYSEPLGAISKGTGLGYEEVQRQLSKCKDIVLYEKGLLSTNEFFARIRMLFDLDVPLEAFQKTWGSIFTFAPDGEKQLLSPELFHRLKNEYQIVALSNTNELHFNYLLDACPLMSEFDDYVLSYRVGSVKPEEQIYRTALNTAGCQPEEAIFVDDRPENVQTAKSLGMKGIVFTGEPALRTELVTMGILSSI